MQVPIQILGSELPQVGCNCMMGLGYYEENHVEELDGIPEAAALLENKVVRWTVIALQMLRQPRTTSRPSSEMDVCAR